MNISFKDWKVYGIITLIFLIIAIISFFTGGMLVQPYQDIVGGMIAGVSVVIMFIFLFITLFLLRPSNKNTKNEVKYKAQKEKQEEYKGSYLKRFFWTGMGKKVTTTILWIIAGLIISGIIRGIF